MIVLSGTVRAGFRHFERRMTEHSDAFAAAAGERLYPGTVNVHVARPVPVREHFRLIGATIGHAHEDFIFEVIRIGPHWAYRIRPLDLVTGAGGHGDDVIEVACATKLPLEITAPNSVVELTFFRNSLAPAPR